MINPKTLEQLANKVQDSLPKGIRDLSDDLERKIRQILQNQFSRINLVSREEFDIQTKVLLHTRNKLNQLEQRLDALETILKNNQTINQSLPVSNTIER